MSASPNPELVNDFDSFAEDLLDETHERSLIILGAAKIDILLLAILNAYLLPKRAKTRDNDELLEGDRPLSTFSARIKICYRLGLIDETLFVALEQLRSIRNPSAHALSFDMTKAPMRERVNELRKSINQRESYKLTRTRFFDMEQLDRVADLQCVLLTICVLLEAIRSAVVQTGGLGEALKISVR